jgi:signal transduction histidine kinase
LALCRKIAANHGGYISATGEENTGAKVIVILPVKAQRVNAGS